MLFSVATDIELNIGGALKQEKKFRQTAITITITETVVQLNDLSANLFFLNKRETKTDKHICIV